MSLIDLLIAPITEDNIVNNIRLEKKSPIPFASKILPNSKRRKNYEFKYNNKQFNTILQGSKKIITDHSIDVKASAQLGWTVDTSNELEYLNYILNTEENHFKYDFLCLLDAVSSDKIIRKFQVKNKKLFIYGVKRENIKDKYPYYIVD